jgi:hypothetical protein
MKTVDGDLVAYCGLCCLDCHGFRQKTADLARDLRKELRQTKYKKFADFISQSKFGEVFKDYDICYEVLGAMVRFRCRRGCRAGGGPPFCKIRKCCMEKGYIGCWEFSEFEECDKLEFLQPVHGDAAIKNLGKIKKEGLGEFLKGGRRW